MSEPNRGANNKQRGRRWGAWRWIVGVGLILVAGGHYVWTSLRSGPGTFHGVEPRAIRVAPDLKLADAVPVERGALAGGNVLLVTIDAARADRLGCYGNDQIETPVLNRLAGEGVLFSAGTAVAPTPLPSHASILTGLYPAHHGVRDSGLFRLDDGQVTLAEILRSRGYATAATVSSFLLDSAFGLAQGFEHYDDLVDPAPSQSGGSCERKGDPTTARALEWLRGAVGRPFFLWVHYADPRAPYEPAPPFSERYTRDPYDGEIASVDAEIGRLIDAVGQLGLTERTLIVIVGSHGESLGQHGEWGHGHLLYEATLRIPLILRCGRPLRGGGVHVAHRVSQVDIMPTILSLLGLPAPDRTDGLDLTSQTTQARAIYAETLHGMIQYGWAPLLAVYEGPSKYIHGPKPELFDLSNDPDEKTNLLVSKPAGPGTPKERLTALFGPDLDLATWAPPKAALPAPCSQRLAALGYVGSPAVVPAVASRADPKDTMAALARLDRVARDASLAPSIQEKIDLLEQLAKDFPDFHPAFRFLGHLYRLSDRPQEAIRAYQKCLDLCPDPMAGLELATIRLQLGEAESASGLLREIVSEHPDCLAARYFLGVAADQAERPEEAVEQFSYIFNADPDFEHPGTEPFGLQLTQVYVKAGRAAELPGMLRPRLDADPRASKVRAALAAYHTSQKQYAQAEALLREGVALAPDDRTAITNLATYLVSCPDPDARRPYEGVAMMERLCERTAYQDPDLLSSLGRAYSMVGRVEEAIAVVEKARALASQGGNQVLAEWLSQVLVELNRAKQTGRSTTEPASG